MIFRNIESKISSLSVSFQKQRKLEHLDIFHVQYNANQGIL